MGQSETRMGIGGRGGLKQGTGMGKSGCQGGSRVPGSQANTGSR